MRGFAGTTPSVMSRSKQQRGLQKHKGDRSKNGERGEKGFSYKVDPYTLKSGDYVVHKKVGIGRFVGIKFDVPKGSNEPIEYVFIEYADGMAKLPVKQARRILYRYNLPNETKRPRALSKLNDTSLWERKKTKGKLTIQKMVVDLMESYLYRLKQRKPSYPKAPAMVEFEAQFPCKPTPDQKQAFIDVEKDLTVSGTPMDRLICGDVGFGKTEVALRAIFCVVSAGKQAMVLAPTIVLAKQHFDVISEQFCPYPNIQVGLLSRFQTRSEKEEYLGMINEGHLDIIVGTHSLLGSRVVYNNLGLLVVDEEQPLAKTVISAIKSELERGGQVFYVLPRIKGLKEVMEFLEQSFTDIELAIAHGKQYSKHLEDTMEKFAQGEIRILICTMWRAALIFKMKTPSSFRMFSSLVLSNSFHCISHWYKWQSFADTPKERLAALEEYCKLGQGFQLAERDMGIRGFGTIFGEQQTGDVGNVGIDLFFEMLFESLSKVEEHRVFPVTYQDIQN
ncbi:hypothetical protein SAY86_022746 [Trapa natans]|uniref:Helicase ATP-binding domain-containing protein n=1 Tax=Trapa natans TaxID=22666 RepID=A0AAN7LTF5_TRANT|nr:hypothetical protein SAY86_022746 [Trapa natans]